MPRKAEDLPIEIPPEITGSTYKLDENPSSRVDKAGFLMQNWTRNLGRFHIGKLTNTAEKAKKAKDWLEIIKAPIRSQIELPDTTADNKEDLEKQIIKLTIDYFKDQNISISKLLNIHEQSELGTYGHYLNKTFNPEKGYAGGISPGTKKLSNVDFNYQEKADGTITLTTTANDFHGVKLDPLTGDFSDEAEKIFKGNDTIETVNTYHFNDDETIKSIDRTFRTDSPELAAELVLGYLERKHNKENPGLAMGSEITKNNLVAYIAANPSFPKEMYKNKLTKPNINKILKLFSYCNGRVNKLKNPSALHIHSVFRSSPGSTINSKSIAQYQRIAKLKISDQLAIARAIEKNPSYLENIHFKFVDSIAKRMQYLDEGIKLLLDARAHENNGAILKECIMYKEMFSDSSIAFKYLNEKSYEGKDIAKLDNFIGANLLPRIKHARGDSDTPRKDQGFSS